MITHARKNLSYGGTQLSSFGVYINGSGVFDSADPDVEFIRIPGRSGDLVRNRGRYTNIEITYPTSFIVKDFDTQFRALKAFLLSKTDKYYQIEDDYQPDHFRMGVVDAGLSVSDIRWNGNAGSFDLRFNCKPQLYLKSGQTNFALFGASGTITNSTSFTARPLIRVSGAGTLTIGQTSITVASHGFPFIDIDSELMDCSCSGQNANQYVTVANEEYPVLKPGANNYAVDGFSRVIVTPRWWTL